MTIPDGNTTALRQHSAAEDRRQERFDAYSDRAIRSVVNDILDGDAIKGVRSAPPLDLIAADFIVDVAEWIDAEDFANLITGNEAVCERIVNQLRARLAEKVREWCEQSATGQNLVDERVRDLDEDARNDNKGD